MSIPVPIPTKNEKMHITVFPLVGMLLISAYFLYCAFNASGAPEDWHFIDNVNLIFHEAGHPIFSFIFSFLGPFSDFLHVAGGTIFQLIIPIICGLTFYAGKQFYSSLVMLMWTGQNLTNISVYAADALAMQLPLLGGDSVIHDWNYMLSYMGLLHYTNTIADIINISGVMLIFIAIGAAVYKATVQNN